MKLKKIIVKCIPAVLLVGAMSMSASATTISRSSNGRSFKKAWEAYASGTSYTMIYGYNTLFFNEDYTWTRNNTTSHTAIVKNGRGQYSDDAKKGKWAKIEVRHKGSAITYKMVY